VRGCVSAHRFQIAVIGSGFAGSLMAMIAQRLGFSTALIERGRHPRFVIGESSTPLANLLLEELSDEYGLEAVKPLCKWGSWQKHLPRLACGLKRGFSFYHHEFDRGPRKEDPRQGQLLVGASPNDDVADTHWYRPDFDQYLVKEAEKGGVTYWDETELTAAEEESSGMRLVGSRRGKRCAITAEFVIDASGARGFLFQALSLPEKAPPGFPATQALFSHFENVGSIPPQITNCAGVPPYPPESAAVHHVFPGGWIWVLRFNNGLTSAGVASTTTVADEFQFKCGAAGWQRLVNRLPAVAEIFREARPVRPFVHLPLLSFQSEAVAGSRWVLLPSAAGFVDPLLSTGFALTLLGVARLGRLLRMSWKRPSFDSDLVSYARLTTEELEIAFRLVGALYANMGRFDIFKQLTLLYFAASSYSETARRLGKPNLAGGFLLCRDPAFASEIRIICETACRAPRPDALNLADRVRQAIERFDVAGLTDTSRDPYYPALPSDLLRSAAKLDATADEISFMLRRCGVQPD
jgi:tetracycline 7-halogenase / FADH2 O2-dependent halogenase